MRWSKQAAGKQQPDQASELQKRRADEPELARACEASPEEAFTVAALYQIVLGRAPDAAGALFYLHELRAGRSARSIASDMLNSEEYRRKHLPVEWWRAACRNVKQPEAPPRLLQSKASFCSSLATNKDVRRLGRLLIAQTMDPLRSYHDWIGVNDKLEDSDRQAIRDHIARLKYKPLISIVMPVHDTRERFLREAIGSVVAQHYENWELCIADDASSLPHVWAVIQEFSRQDARIKPLRRERNGHVSAASNSALAMATGEFVAMLDHDDALAAHALYEVVNELNANPDANLIYSDEDLLTEDGRRGNPYFKTDWNPELFFSHNMINHLAVYRRSILEKVGGFREGFEGSQDYDLALRVVQEIDTGEIRHIAAVLYHWRVFVSHPSLSTLQLDRCIDAARRAKKEYFARRGETVDVVGNPQIPAHDRVVRSLSREPLVSIIVPTKNRHELLQPCIDGLLQRTDYKNKEIIIIDHESDEPPTRSLLTAYGRRNDVRIMRYSGPFNYADMNNKAVALARGEIVALLNNDVDVISTSWLNEMVAHAIHPETGAVGAKLLYPDGSIQHAGVFLGILGTAGHAYVGAGQDETGYFGRLVHASNVSAVTGACLVVRKCIFEQVGGLNARDLPVAYNDIDLCLRIRAAGYRNVWTPFAVLHHHESASRGSDKEPRNVERAQREIGYFLRTWGEELLSDPYYNPNLTLERSDYQLATYSRRVKPWTTN